MGRKGAPTRLELHLSSRERLRVAASPEHLGSCLEQVGFHAFDGQVLEDVSELVSIGIPNSLQLDIMEDGKIGNTLSLTSSFEGIAPDYSRHFEAGGIVARVNGVYERMGVADRRWRLAEQALFADMRVLDVGSGPHLVPMLSAPLCGKAKWVDGRRVPAKFYLIQRNVVGRRWALGGLFSAWA